MANTDLILQKFLVDVAEKMKYSDGETKIKQFSSGGANYTSNIYRVTMKAPEKDTLNLFAKVGKLSSKLRETLNAETIYSNERLFFNDLAGKYEAIQDKFGITQEDRLKLPKVYDMNATRFEETVVLEDLGEKGYEMWDRMKVVTMEYATMAMSTLAKWHALSFVYQHEYPEEYAKHFEILKLDLAKAAEEIKTVWFKVAHKTFAVVDEDKRRRLTAFLEDLCTEEKFAKYYGVGRCAQILHGDFRPSNLMHKSVDDKLVDMMPIDFQTIRIGAPVTDLFYFIYSSTDMAFRKENMTELLEIYYKYLSKYLSMYKLNPDEVYPRAEFDDDYKELNAVGLAVTILLLPIVLVEPENIPNVASDNANLEDFATNTSKLFNVRFNEIVDEYISKGII